MTLPVAAFFASVAFLLYVLAGYPLILAAYARLFPRPIRKQSQSIPITIVVPVRNGARWIEAKIRSLLSSAYPQNLLKILVVSDGSIDNTANLVRAFSDARVTVLELPPGGKAVAVNRALEQVSDDVVILTDVRQTFDEDAVAKLIACFADPAVGVVTGELVIRDGSSLEEFNTGLYWRYEKWIRQNLNRIDAMLGATGAIYAIRRNLVAPLPADTLLDDVFLPFAAAFRGSRIYFEREAKAFDFPTSLDSEFWRKVRTQAGVYQILFRFPALLWPGNRRFIHFLSHKMGRLLLPVALIVAAVVTPFLPHPWNWLALSSQAAFYLLAALDPLIPERTALKRLSAVVRTFVVLVASAFCATLVFILPAQSLWRETRVGPVPGKSTGTPV